jgi:hypothetical protein
LKREFAKAAVDPRLRNRREPILTLLDFRPCSRAIVALTIGTEILALIGAQLHAQSARPAASLTPASWLQLRNGTDNVGVAKGSLSAEWHYKASLPVRAISVADGKVLLGSESATAESTRPSGDQRGLLTALDAKTGALIWSRFIPTWIHSDVLLYKGRVYVTCGRWPMVHVGGMLALDEHTGRTVWAVRADAGMMPGAAIDTAEQSITAAGGDGTLLTVSLSDGAKIRSTGLRASDGMSSVRLDDSGTVYIGAASTLLSYSARTGQVNWRYRPPMNLRALGDVPVALDTDIVFTTGTRKYGFMNAWRTLPASEFAALIRKALRTERLRNFRGWFEEQLLMAVDRTTGLLVWSRPLGIGLSIPRNQSGTPVLVKDHVIVSSPISQTVWAFNVADGQPLWNRRLDAMHKGAVTVTGDDIVLGDKSGTVTFLRLSDGGVVASCSTDASFSVTAPVVIGKTLIAATRDGNVWAAPYDSVRERAIRKAKCFRK